jgi:hypothetical protein
MRVYVRIFKIGKIYEFTRLPIQYEQSHHMNWRQLSNMVLHCWFTDDFECSATEHTGIGQAQYIKHPDCTVYSYICMRCRHE